MSNVNVGITHSESESKVDKIAKTLDEDQMAELIAALTSATSTAKENSEKGRIKKRKPKAVVDGYYPEYFSAYSGYQKHRGWSDYQINIDQLEKALEAGERILLTGQPGTGKTTAVEYIGKKWGQRVVRVNFCKDMTVGDFVGENTIGYDEDGKQSIRFNYGPLALAMKEGHILLMDEIDHAPAECTSILHAPMERGGKLMCTANGGEEISPHDKFRLIATANTRMRGDMTGKHAGAQVADWALISRFDMTAEVSRMSILQECELLEARCGVGNDVALGIAEYANEVNKSYEEDLVQYPLTTRQTMSWARNIKTLGFKASFALCVLATSEQTDAPTLVEYAQRKFGVDMDPAKRKKKENEEDVKEDVTG